MYDSQILLQSYIIIPYQQQLKFRDFEHEMMLYVYKHLPHPHCQEKDSEIC